jgi:hypothetical protein
LYGCETLPLIIRRDHSLRVFENRVLRRILGPKREEVTGAWRKLYGEGLHNLCSLLYIMTAIWKVTSGVLLTKQAMREKNIIYKKYIHT